MLWFSTVSGVCSYSLSLQEAVSAATNEERLGKIHNVIQQLPPPHYRSGSKLSTAPWWLQMEVLLVSEKGQSCSMMSVPLWGSWAINTHFSSHLKMENFNWVMNPPPTLSWLHLLVRESITDDVFHPIFFMCTPGLWSTSWDTSPAWPPPAPLPICTLKTWRLSGHRTSSGNCQHGLNAVWAAVQSSTCYNEWTATCLSGK